MSDSMMVLCIVACYVSSQVERQQGRRCQHWCELIITTTSHSACTLTPTMSQKLH